MRHGRRSMTRPRSDGYRARRVLDDNAALIREAKQTLQELRHEIPSMKGAVLVAEALRRLAEIQTNELRIRTGNYEQEE